jgi:hypothetical protein
MSLPRPIINPKPKTRADAEAVPLGHFDIFNRLVRDGHLKKMTLVELRTFLVHLACRNQGDGRSFPGLANQTELAASSQRDLLRALKGLETKGYIRKVVQGGGKARKVRGIWIRSSEYELDIPDGETVVPGATKAMREDRHKRPSRGSTGARCANDPCQQHESNSQLPKPRIETPKPIATAGNGLNGFEILDGKEKQELDDAINYLADPEGLGVWKQTVLDALKKFGPAHILAIAAFAGEQHGAGWMENPGGLLAKKLRAGPEALPKSHNGHAKKRAYQDDQLDYDEEGCVIRKRLAKKPMRIFGEDGREPRDPFADRPVERIVYEDRFG